MEKSRRKGKRLRNVKREGQRKGKHTGRVQLRGKALASHV
jgi:hypothetical protein